MILFAATVFISAFLLFLMQPMIAKMILPLLGGSPAVWNTCMLFFQAILLLGYTYVHAITDRLGFRRQLFVHRALILLPLSVLPIGLASGWVLQNHDNPIPGLLGLLTVSIGLPFFVLSTTAPLLQKWFANTNQPSARDPYFLYAASNLGSMIALLGYPIAIEPYLSLKGGEWISQSSLWSFGYAFFTILVFVCAWNVQRSHKNGGIRMEERSQQTSDEVHVSSRIRTPTYLRWVALAFVPSSLMLGVTSYISLNITAIPLFWVIPLAVYLLSFILVFTKWPTGFHKALVFALPFVLLLLVFSMMPSVLKIRFWVIILIHLLGLFIVATVCHGELSLGRPRTQYLTLFYLFISLGGVMGGIFNALIAPLVFNGIVEYQLTLVFAGLILPSIERKNRSRVKRWFFPNLVVFPGVLSDVAWAILLGAVTIALLWFNNSKGDALPWLFSLTGIESSLFLSITGYSIPVLLCYFFVGRPIRFGLGLGAILLAAGYFSAFHGDVVLHQERTFFGVLKVKFNREENSQKLIHGTTLHGEQSLDPARRREALTYYHLTGPIGQVLNTFSGPHAKQHIAVIGLGSGTLASYMEHGQSLTFYEIDPALLQISQNQRFFTYYDDSKKRGVDLKVILGDARVSLQQAEENSYELIILDAFSSDAIPVHLITREALVLYFKKLKADGILAVHISNRYLNLEPVLGNLEKELHLVALNQSDDEDDDEEFPGKSKSHWVILAKQREAFGSLNDDKRWTPPESNPKVGVWTDNFSNVLSVFKWHSNLR